VRDETPAGQRDHADRLAVIRARIRRSLDDPRLNLETKDVDRRLKALFASTKKARRRDESSDLRRR